MVIETKLREVVLDDLDEICKMEVGTEARKEAVNDVTDLIHSYMTLEEMNRSSEIDTLKTEIEKERLDMETKDRKIKNIIQGTSIGLGAFGTFWGTWKVLDFEKTNVVRSFMKVHIQNLVPKATFWLKK